MTAKKQDRVLLVIPAAIALILTVTAWLLCLLYVPYATVVRACAMLIVDVSLLLFAVLLASKNYALDRGFRVKFILLFAVIAAAKNLLLMLTSTVIASCVKSLFLGAVLEKAAEILLSAVAIVLLAGVFAGKNPLSGRSVLFVGVAALILLAVTMIPSALGTALLLHRMTAAEGSGALSEMMVLMAASPTEMILSDIPSLLIAPGLGLALRLGRKASES